MKSLLILMVGLAVCAMGNPTGKQEETQLDSEIQLGQFVLESDKTREFSKIEGTVLLADDHLEIKNFAYKPEDGSVYKLVAVKFVGVTKEGDKKALTFTAQGQEVASKSEWKGEWQDDSQVALESVDPVKNFGQILVVVRDNQDFVLSTATLTFPKPTTPAPTTTTTQATTTTPVKITSVTIPPTKGTTKDQKINPTSATQPATTTTHGTSGSSTFHAGMSCLTVAAITVIGQGYMQ